MEAGTAFLLRRFLGIACFWATAASVIAQPAPADRLLVSGRVYTFACDERSPDGFRPEAEVRKAEGG